VRWVRSVANPRLGADGNLLKVYGTVTDITEFESLRSSLKDKEVLLKEIHHRVKNNLQIVVSLMRLESRAFSEEKVRAAIKDLETRVRAMALVHEHLYHSSDLAKIGFRDYLKVLCEELFRTYSADGGRIRLEIDAEAVALDIGRAIPCGLIVNELLTNAIKYAFPGNRKGLIRIAIRNISGNEVEIAVSDDGIGLPETLDIRNTQTLGLQLVTTLVENQLKGRVELERADGTRFSIRFEI
jgi:two-component sensor histidine kinase